MDLFIKILADGTLLAIAALSAGVLLFLVPPKRWGHVVPYAIMAGLTSLLVGKVMSLLYQPAVARPFLELGAEPGAAYIDNPGFPSDHVLLATFIVLTVGALTRRRYLTAILGVCVVVMAIARVVALVHTPLDVIGGALAGLSGGVWYLFLTKKK